MLSCFLILLCPFFGALLSSLFGKNFGILGASSITIIFMGFSLFFAVITFYKIGFLQTPIYFILGSWLQSDMLNINWGFTFDPLTITMLLVITSVSFLVHLFSLGYMGDDPHLARFMSYLSLFTFFMIILVTSDNFIILFLG